VYDETDDEGDYGSDDSSSGDGGYDESEASADDNSSAPTPISVGTSIPLIAQPTDVTCWAASLAMVAGASSAEEVADKAGMDINTGYGWPEIQAAVSAWGLNEEGGACGMPDFFAGYLQSYGPLWIVEVGAPYHAVVVTGMEGDGTPDGTNVYINNPWPPGSGAQETKTFTAFEAEYELGAGASASIVHR
jgi:hypothetical protein